MGKHTLWNEKITGFIAIFIVCSLALASAGCTETKSATTTPRVKTIDILSGTATITAQGQTTVPATTGTPPTTTGIQKLAVSGSTSVLPIVQLAAESFMAQHSLYDIQITGGGSGAGITAIGAETVDIGMSSRDLKPEEKTKYPDLVTHYICDDGIAIVVNLKNTLEGLTLDDIRAIYAGNISDWKDVKGAPGTIVVFGRESTSGTRDFFHEHIMKGSRFTPSILEKNSNGAIAQAVTQTPGAIGYVSLGYIMTDSSIKPVPVLVNGTSRAPSIATVQDRSYPIWRPLYLFTKGAPSPRAKVFIDYMLSPDGQRGIQAAGGVPLKE